MSDYDEADLHIEKPKTHAAGPVAVAVSMKRALGHMGPVRTARTLLDLNQAESLLSTVLLFQVGQSQRL